MPPKKGPAPPSGKASKKKAKPVFDPFERVCAFTSIPLRDPTGTGGDVSKPPVSAAAPPLAVSTGSIEGDGSKVAEFTASELTFMPPLPRTEVVITLKFRVTVALTEGDIIYAYLPKFGGPAAQQFALQNASPVADVRNDDEGINTATYFRAFWSGTTAKVTSAVNLMEFKRGKKGGAPPKQVLLLQCLKDVPAHALLVFSVPRSLGIVSPDKLPVNSSKLKLEGPQIYEAESHRILKQIILTSSGIRKQTVVEELGIFERCIAQVIRESGLQSGDRQLCEQLSLEEVDQIRQAAQYRRRYPVPMAWTVAQEVCVAYEAAGSFVKRIVQNAITCIKDFDPLAVHKEVARNWGVKPAAVVMLDDFLSVQWAGLYPGLPRTTLFAACLLTMDPEDVGRAFLSVSQLPPRSIAEDLMSAFRTRASLDGVTAVTDSAKPPTTTNVMDGNGKNRDNAETADLMQVILEKGGSVDRCGAILDKWSALITALLPAAFVVESTTLAAGNGQGAYASHDSHNVGGEDHKVSKDSGPRIDFERGVAQDGSPAPGMDGRGRRGSRRNSNSGNMAINAGGGAVAILHPPPTLYLGYRDVPSDVQRSLRELQQGDWFVLPFQAVARQSLPYAAVTPSTLAATAQLTKGDEKLVTANYNEGEDSDEDDGAAAAIIPDNAVVVELHHVVEALELADVSLSPYNRAWLLPLATSCRVVTVEEDQHEVLHVVVDMEGSLVGHINDEDLPQSDRSVATVILGKYLVKAEQTDFYVSSFSLLTAFHAQYSERRRLHPPTLIRAQYLSHYNAALRASAAKYNVEETERVEWQVRTHDAQLLEEGVVKPAVWEPIQRKYMVTVEQFFLGHSCAVQKLEEGTLSVDLGTYTIDYGGKGPRALRRVVDKVYVTHEAVPAETSAILAAREEQYTKQLLALDNKLGISPSTAGTTAAASNGKGESAKRSRAAAGKSKKG